MAAISFRISGELGYVMRDIGGRSGGFVSLDPGRNIACRTTVHVALLAPCATYVGPRIALKGTVPPPTDIIAKPNDRRDRCPMPEAASTDILGAALAGCGVIHCCKSA